MQNQTPSDRRIEAIAAALSLNRAEIDAERLERLLRLIETQAVASPSAAA